MEDHPIASLLQKWNALEPDRCRIDYYKDGSIAGYYVRLKGYMRKATTFMAEFDEPRILGGLIEAIEDSGSEWSIGTTKITKSTGDTYLMVMANLGGWQLLSNPSIPGPLFPLLSLYVSQTRERKERMVR